MNIPQNDGVLSQEEQATVDKITKEVLNGLKDCSMTKVYKSNLWRGEYYHRIVGSEFKKQGYYVAYDYVPNGYQGMVVSKHPIGEPSGRMVSREWN